MGIVGNVIVGSDAVKRLRDGVKGSKAVISSHALQVKNRDLPIGKLRASRDLLLTKRGSDLGATNGCQHLDAALLDKVSEQRSSDRMRRVVSQ